MRLDQVLFALRVHCERYEAYFGACEWCLLEPCPTWARIVFYEVDGESGVRMV